MTLPHRIPPRARPALAALAALALPLAAVAQPRPRLAVLDLAAVGASRELTSAAGTAVASELDRLGAFQVMTAEAVRSLLAFEKQRQMLGCTDAGCVAELAGALGADYVVAGKVTRLAGVGLEPDTLTLDLTLLSARDGARAGAAVESATSEAVLVTRIPRAVARLTAAVRATRAGRLLVTSSEAGAVVAVDEVVVGTTPLQSALSLPAGPHALRVEKKGFVTFQKDLRIEAGQGSEERALLVPSPDFVREYESRAGKLRTGAWISTGVAAVGAVAAVVLQVNAAKLYGNESTRGTFLYDRRRIQDGVTEEDGKDLRAEASRLKSRIRTSETLSYVAGGVSVLAAGAAVWLWVAGDDPDRYAPYREQKAAVALQPVPGGAVASLQVKF